MGKYGICRFLDVKWKQKRVEREKGGFHSQKLLLKTTKVDIFRSFSLEISCFSGKNSVSIHFSPISFSSILSSHSNMLPPEYADINDDVKESFLRSADLKTSLSRITTDIGTNAFHRAGAASAAREHVQSRPAFKAVSHSPTTRHAPDATKSPLSKHAGKATLSTRLQLFNQRLVLTKAGKPLTIVSDDTCASPVLDRVIQLTTPHSDNSFHKLPHVSLINGKVKPPLQLPTYQDYCVTHKVDFKGPRNEKVLRHAKETIDRLEKLKRQINGLAILLDGTQGTPWNRDKKILYKLDKNPDKRGAILKAYSGNLEHRRVSMANEPQKASDRQDEHRSDLLPTNRSAITPPPARSGHEAYRLIRQRADDFAASQLQQNQRLIDILDRYEVERSFMIQRKSRLISKDKERFKDIGHALQRFQEYRREADDARSQRVERAKGQVVLYEQLLECLKTQEASPSEPQLLCLDIIRGLLEEGWTLDLDVISKVRGAVGDSPDTKKLLDLLETQVCR